MKYHEFGGIGSVGMVWHGDGMWFRGCVSVQWVDTTVKIHLGVPHVLVMGRKGGGRYLSDW